MGHPALTQKIYDVAVVGAGIVGTACASELSRAGLRVCLIEPNMIGGGATAAGMGHITVMDDSPAQFALTRYSQLLWKELAGRLGTNAEYVTSGAIWVAADDAEMAEVQRKHRYYTERNTPVEILDARALAEAEPNLRNGLPGGLLVKEDAVVYPPAVAQFLAAQTEELGGDLMLGKRAVAVGESSATLDDGSEVLAGKFVLAMGAAAESLVPGLNVRPRKGHLVITDRYPGFLRHQLIELGYLKSAHASQADSVAFNIQPRATGQLLIGSSRQFGTGDAATERGILSAMLQRAFEYMPALRKFSAVRSWTGFRAATPDKLPLIGLCPGTNNLYLATGHEGLGITTSLGTSKLIASLLLGHKCAVPSEPYSPDRSFALHA